MFSRAPLAKQAPAPKAPAQAKSAQTKQAQTYFAQNETELASPQFAYSLAGVRTFAEGEPNEGPEGYFANRRLPFPIQAKLAVGAVNDPLETEADRVADQVMRIPEPQAGAQSLDQKADASALQKTSVGSSLQRKCDCGGTCDDCKTQDKKAEHDEHAKVQMKAAAPNVIGGFEAPPIVHEVLRSSGQPLDAATRKYMEPRFGYDFGKVQVHSNRHAAQSAAAVGARAFTVGHHLVFGDGVSGGSFADKKLIAHELAHVVQQIPVPSRTIRRTNQLFRDPAPCSVTFKKATTFKELIDLVRAAETKLAAAGITGAQNQIHALRGVYYGTPWSLDFSVEKSTTRNEGFQRFTRPSQNPGSSVPPDVSATLDCGLFKALQDSQDMVDGPRHFDFGHMLIALDARYDPDFSKNVKYPVMGINIDLGGTGTELVTWLGDLGGGTAAVAVARVSAPTTNVSTRFSGSDYGGSINLEGDIAGYVVASGASTSLATPNIVAGKGLSDALQDYLTPGAATSSSAWSGRAKTFLTMQGATFDSSGNLSNRAALISAFAPKIKEFACNYLASRVKDSKISSADAKSAANHVTPVSEEVAEAFVDALDDSAKTGNKIEAKKFPTPKPAGPGACSTQLTAAGLLQLLH